MALHQRIRSEGNNDFQEMVSDYTGQPATEYKNPLLFQFTRHATSCFNIEIYRDRGASLTGGIPSLADIGITNTISLANKNRKTNRFQSSVVCVSNLVRTWMTAVLLYTFSDKTSITLRICPHLKETGWTGNKAYSLTLSVSTFIDFLKLIRNNTFYGNLREIILLIPAHIETPHNNWVKIKITIPKGNSVNTKIHTDPLFCDRVNTIDKIDGYNKDGNIYKFMEWYHESFPEEQGIVHIVAHSGIMKEYVKKICNGYIFNGIPFDIKNYSINEQKIDNQNCWTFTTPMLDVSKEELIKSIQPGYINPGKGASLIAAQDSEKQKGNKSLCFKNVEPITCNIKNKKLSKGGSHHKKYTLHTKKNHMKSRRIKSIRKSLRRL